MSCYLIKVENGHKVARPITSEEEYKQLRGSNEQKANLRQARAGSDAAKRRLVQFNYSGHYPQGVVKGMKLPSSAFGFDMDEPEAFAQAAKLLLKEPGKYGLLMLERSARQGGHAVFEREKGKTILENQVRIATMLECEMDTSAHDINRVYFTTTSDDEDLLFLSPHLFQDAYDEAAVAAEAKVLEEREKYGQEELPEGAHKANKHYKPWENPIQNAPATTFGGNASAGSSEKKTGSTAPAASTGKNEAPSPSAGTPKVSAPSDLKYLGIPYSDIIAKWWLMYNDGQEPVKSNRNTLTFELAVNLRHICGFDRNLMAQVIPCYDGFPDQEKMACINSALSEKITQMPKRLKDVLSAIRQEKLNKNAATGATGTDEDDEAFINALDEANAQDDQFYYNALPKLPQGIKDSVDAVGPALAMPVISAICPVIGMLATGVKVSVHGKMNSLNLISYIAGDFASGKGSIDPIINTWTKELKDMDKMYLQTEEDWRVKKRAAKLGVSRTPIREAIRMLEQEGLAVTIPRKGAEVAKMTEKDMEDVLQIREALDELAAKIACEQISEEQLEELVATMHEFEESTKTDNVKKIAEADVKFHDIIYQSTGNPKLVNMLNNLREQMYRYRVEYLKDENNYPTLMKEHKDIVEGLVRKNKMQVTETMHQHVKNQAVAVKAMIQEQE